MIEERLRQRALRVCEQIRKLDNAIRDASGSSHADETPLFQALENSSCQLLEIAEAVERDLHDWGPTLEALKKVGT